tara:strand:+ start:1270 stop:1755 length:486 start_codon:yes stop_codon:yes gene_type:complete
MPDTTDIVITNVQPNKFAFAVILDTGEHVYIPGQTADKIKNLGVEDILSAVLVPNVGATRISARDKAPWKAVKLIDSNRAKPASVSLDEQAYAALTEVAYATSADIAYSVDADKQSVSNAMQRLFNAGRISRADVFHRVGQQRASYVLYALNSADFLGADS